MATHEGIDLWDKRQTWFYAAYMHKIELAKAIADVLLK